MIIYENGEWQTDSNYPDTLYDDNALYCVPDNTPLAIKYRDLYPNADLITDETGELIDIQEKVRPLSAEELKTNYDALCVTYIREMYSADDEYKILREYLADMSNPTEFNRYNNYVNECKARAYADIYKEEK